MDDIPAYDPQRGSQIEQAFEELKRPAADAQSCLRIARACTDKEHPPVEQNEEKYKRSLMRWLVVEALHTNAHLFSPHTHKLKMHFDQLLTQETAKELEKRTQADAILATMQQGETFQKLKASQNDVLSRLKAHKPLVVSIINAGYGDTMLMIPLIEDIAITLKLMGSRSNIRCIVKERIAEIISFMLRSRDNIEVIPYRQLGETYVLYLARLAVEDKPPVQFNDEGPPFIANYAEKAGIILDWEKWGDYTASSFLKGTVYHTMRKPATEIIPVDVPDKDRSSTARRSMQRWISQTLGVKIFDTPTRDDVTTLSLNLQAYLETHATATKDAQKALHQLRGTPGFEQGFICIVSQGSNQVKRIMPGLANLIAQELADFCQHCRVGIVLICPPNPSNAEERDYATIVTCFLAHGIATYQFHATNRIADALFMLQHARGVIGPDTFLTHAAEYFQDTPVVNFLADSAKCAFRVDARVITVQHPIAKRAEETLRVYAPVHSELYAHEIVHPFTPLFSKEQQAHFHPLIQEAQKSLLQEARRGLREFQNRMRNSSYEPISESLREIHERPLVGPPPQLGSEKNTMDDIAAYDSEKGSQIDQAFEELRQPGANPQSCLRIAKAYMCEGRSPLERSNENIKGSLIRWLVVEALQTNPSLFGQHAYELRTYFDRLVTQETVGVLQRRIQMDVLLSKMQYGEAFKEMNASQVETLSRLKAHKPLVISMAYGPYGDTMLMTPAIMDIAKAFEKIGIRSRIRYIVKDGIVDLVRCMLWAQDNTEVIAYNNKYDRLYYQYLAKLAVENTPEIQFTADGTPSIVNYAGEAGIILGWERPGEAYTSQSFFQGTVFGRLKTFNSRILPLDGPNNVFANTARRSLQRDLSDFLGLKIFENATRDDITQLSQGVQTFLQMYITTKEGEAVRPSLEELNKQAGFENGYLCVISQGSKDVKRIPPALADVIADELEDFCKQNHIGIVLIQTSSGDDVTLSFRFAAHGIPIHQFPTTKRVADTLLLLQGARGVIGPDTFLLHASEYFQDTPIVNFHADSAQRVFRINDRVIPVQHPIAKWAEANLRVYLPDHSELYMREMIHPLTPLLTLEEQSSFHPLIQEAQNSLLHEAKGGLNEFKYRIMRTSASELVTRNIIARGEKYDAIDHCDEQVLQRFAGNPIISPKREHQWEGKSTFNPAAIYAGGRVHIIYRALAQDYTSTFGYAVSEDGLHIDERLDVPIYIPREAFELKKYSGLSGCEDPRITRIEDKFYMTYVAFDSSTNPRIALTSITANDFLNRRWTWTMPRLISAPGVTNKNAVLFPEKVNGKYVVLHRIFPNILIDFVDDLEFHDYLAGKSRIEPRKEAWDSLKVGAGAPPIKTRDGWLLIYHAVGLEDRKCYKIGAMLLDLNDPTRVLYRPKHPIMEPESRYEIEGRRSCTVYPCGAVIINGELRVYYGGADSVVCVASHNLDRFLARLKADS